MVINKNFLKNYIPDLSNVLDILIYPNPILLKKSTPVIKFDEELKSLILKMLNTMYSARGIGLAAPQIGINERLIVLDVDYEMSEKQTSDQQLIQVPININPQIFINPIITETEGRIKYQEGCLSLPTIYEDVERYENINVNYHDIEGSELNIHVNELLSICIQHEIDHLDGVVFIDRLSSLKKSISKKKLLKLKK